jgi:RHS repeat-associated protein
VQYVRGSDWGGGVGGLLYSVRGGTPSFKYYNARGDILAESDATGASTWRAQYDAYGTRAQESGTPSADRQRGNTKDEDPSGLRNDGFRYFDLDAQIYLTADPAGFADGPNVYTYVEQNPWSRMDPDGQFWHIISGAAFGAGLDIAVQLIAHGKVNNWSSVAKSAASGAAGAATGAIVGQVAAKVAAVSRTAAAGVRAVNTASRVEQTVENAKSVAQVATDVATGDMKGAAIHAAELAANNLPTPGNKSAKTVKEGQTRDANGRLRDANGRFAYDGGPKPKPVTDSTHRNKLDDRPATLYAKYDKDGNFRKHGITHHEDPSKRYTEAEIAGGRVDPVERGPRTEMAKKERNLVETNPGPDNHEPWAGDKKPK